MRKTNRIARPFAALALVLPAMTGQQGHAASAPVVAVAQDQIEYTVRAGDNLYQIASRYLVRQADYREVQRINRVADPLRLPVGSRLRVPLRLLRTEPLQARILAARGTVTLESGGAPIRPTAGLAVMPGAVLETGADGFIGLALSNGSQVSLPTRTRVRLVAMRRILLTGSVDFDVAVERGKIETQATPLQADGSRFRLRTPRAVSAIRGTVLRVAYDDAGASATEVVEGKVAVQGDPSAAETMLAQGFGAQVSPGGAVKVEALLPAPELVDAGKVLVDPVVALQARQEAGAKGYHVQVAADSSFADLVTEASADGDTVTLPALADGRWFVRLTALSATGIEGLPQVYSLRRSLTGLSASAAQDGDRITIKWLGQGASDARRLYRFQLVRGDAKAAPMIDEPGLQDAQVGVAGLADGVYFWRVGVKQYADGEVTENWTPFQKFTVTGAGR